MYFIGSKVVSIRNYFFILDYENEKTPFYQRSLCEPVDTSSTVNLLMKVKFPQRGVRKTNPVKTSKNATFIVDKSFLESERDVFADDQGHWIKSKTKTFTFGGTYVKIDKHNQGSFDKVIKVTRYIYYSRSSPDFHRVVPFINESRYIFMQYYFDYGEHDIIVQQPHGNSKRNTRPHRRSKESLKEKIT